MNSFNVQVHTLNICPSGYFSSIPLIMVESGGRLCPKDSPSIISDTLVCTVKPVTDARSIIYTYITQPLCAC